MKLQVDAEMSSQNVVDLAVNEFMNLMKGGHIPVKVFCSSLRCSEIGGKSPYAALKCTAKEEDKDAVHCVFQTVLEELGSLKTFCYVQKSFLNLTSQDKNNTISRLLQCDPKHEVESDTSCCGPSVPCKRKSEVDLTEGSDENGKCSGDLVVLPEHLMTLFLLVWPHNGIWDGTCRSKSSSTFGDYLTTLFLDDVEISTGQYIRSEIKSIKYKLEETLKYHGFENLRCCQKAKCKISQGVCNAMG